MNPNGQGAGSANGNEKGRKFRKLPTVDGGPAGGDVTVHRNFKVKKPNENPQRQFKLQEKPNVQVFSKPKRPEFHAQPKPEFRAQPKPDFRAQPKPEFRAQPKPPTQERRLPQPKPEFHAQPKPQMQERRLPEQPKPQQPPGKKPSCGHPGEPTCGK